MIPTSTIDGTLVISNTPSAIRLAAISLSTEFLAPGTTTSPDSGPARRTVMRQAGGRGGLGRHGPPVCSARVRRRSERSPATWPDEPDVRRGSSGRGPHLLTEQRLARRLVPPAQRALSSSTGGRSATRPDGSSSAPTTGWRSRGSAGCSGCRCGPCIARRGQPPTDTTPADPLSVVGAARPDRRRARRWCSGLLAAASMSSAFTNTLFTQTAQFAADDFGVGDFGFGVGRRRRASRDHHRPAVRRAGRPVGPRARDPDRGLGGADHHRPRRIGTQLPVVGRHPGDRPPARAGARLPDRRRRRRGDAAQQPRLRRQRDGDGERARRRDRRDGAPARRHRRRRAGGSCTWSR